MNEKRKRIIGMIGALLLFVSLYFVYEHLTYVSTDNAQIGAHLVMLSSRVNGTIQKVMVEENQRVKAGATLAQIDPSDLSNASESAQAQLAATQARLREAEISFKRASELFAKQAIPRERFDAAQAAYRDLSARVKSQQAQLEQAQLNVSYTKIVAPADGVIARKSVETGQFVPAGQALFGFVADGERWVTANLKETELEGVVAGKRAKVSVDAISGRTYEGEVVSLSPSTGAVFSLLPPDNATGNFTKVVQRVPVRINLLNLRPEDMDLLRAGLSADVSIRIR